MHLAFRDREDVPATGVGDGRRAGTRLVLAGNQCIASVEGFRATVPGGEYAADLVYQQVPGDRLMRVLIRIAHNRDKELALHSPFVHEQSSMLHPLTCMRLYPLLT